MSETRKIRIVPAPWELALSARKDTVGISASTHYRFLKQRGLSERQLLAPPAHKKFEA